VIVVINVEVTEEIVEFSLDQGHHLTPVALNPLIRYINIEILC